MARREFQKPGVNRQSLSVARNRAGLFPGDSHDQSGHRPHLGLGHLDRLQLALCRVVGWA